MKRYAALLLALVMAFLPLKASAEEADPLKDAKAAVVFDRMREKFLYEKDSHKKLPVASTTKIMTSLLALESEKREEKFTLTERDVSVEGSSMGLMAGDKVSLKGLTYGMLLPSGNDAANSVAFKMAGSPEKFVSCMNERAACLGMKDTKFSTPSGLDSGENLSSAHDMALLANEALKNPLFREIAAKKTAKVDVGQRYLYLKNHNKLLFSDDSFTGVKTGFTKKAGRCLVSSFTSKGREFIIVTLGLYGDFDAHRAVKEKIEKELNEVELSLLFKGGRVKVTGGNVPSLPLHIKESGKRAVFPHELGKLSTLSKMPPFLYAPLGENEIVGEFVVKIEEKEILALPLYTSSGVELRVEENVLKRALWKLGL